MLEVEADLFCYEELMTSLPGQRIYYPRPHIMAALLRVSWAITVRVKQTHEYSFQHLKSIYGSHMEV